MTTTIRACTCKHPQQDKLYGVGYRLHNTTKDGAPRCSVCGQMKTHTVVKPKEKGETTKD